MSSDNIRLLKREDIEDKKWNGCVHFALNALPYGYTWYLDNVAEYWQGLVFDDYRAVLPLVHHKKLGQERIYHPDMTGPLGVFALDPLGKTRMQRFLDAIPDTFADVQMLINPMNPKDLGPYDYYARSTWFLNLRPIYADIKKGFTSELVQKLESSDKEELHLKSNLKPEPVAELFRKISKRLKPALEEQHIHTLHRLMYKAEFYNVGGSMGVFNANEELLAAQFVMFTKNKLIRLIAGSTEEGEQKHAPELLMEHLISTNAGSNRLLDMGAFHAGKAGAFEKQFGCQIETAWLMERKDIPWYHKLLR